MRVLVTGHDGYIGTILAPMLVAAGHEVVGMDSHLYGGCLFGEEAAPVESIIRDVRDATLDDLAGFDAVVHLAAISNDPLGDHAPDTTYEINFEAAVRLATLAKQAGIPRFVFSSSCSLYGAAGTAMLDETAAFNPVTPYGRSKILAEEGISRLADERFSPTHLRHATAYGVSPRLRGDLVLNNLVGFAHTTGGVFIKSDGTPWRPLVHIADISRAFLAVLHAPREAVHDEAFNVGRTDENHQVRDLAGMVEEMVPGAKITYAEGGGPDKRSYRVDCDRLPSTLPEFVPRWTARRGVEELATAFEREGLTAADLEGARYQRIARVREAQESGALGSDLRWRDPSGRHGRGGD